ncbi:hydrolase [Vibrio phage EniLVp02]
MKLYCVMNSYVRGAQLAPQVAHAVAELSGAYDPDEIYPTWLNNHKTVVILEAKPEVLSRLETLCIYVEHPYGSFKEAGLNNTRTGVSFILTEEQLELANEIRNWKSRNKNTQWGGSSTEMDALYEYLNNINKARHISTDEIELLTTVRTLQTHRGF